MGEKLNLLLGWEWMLVSEKTRFSPPSFGVLFGKFIVDQHFFKSLVSAHSDILLI